MPASGGTLPVLVLLLIPTLGLVPFLFGGKARIVGICLDLSGVASMTAADGRFRLGAALIGSASMLAALGCRCFCRGIHNLLCYRIRAPVSGIGRLAHNPFARKDLAVVV